MAHPTKMKKNIRGEFEIPTLYDINGSANFYNKADNGITVHRNKLADTVNVFIQKVKFRHLGETGIATFKYNLNNGRYTPFDPAKPDSIPWDNDNHLTIKLKQIEIQTQSFLQFDPTDFEPAPF